MSVLASIPVETATINLRIVNLIEFPRRSRLEPLFKLEAHFPARRIAVNSVVVYTGVPEIDSTGREDNDHKEKEDTENETSGGACRN